MIHKVLVFIWEFQCHHSRSQNVVFQDVSHILAPTTAAGGDFGEPSGKQILKFSMCTVIKLPFRLSRLLIQKALWFHRYNPTLPIVHLQIVKLMLLALPVWIKDLRFELLSRFISAKYIYFEISAKASKSQAIFLYHSQLVTPVLLEINIEGRIRKFTFITQWWKVQFYPVSWLCFPQGRVGPIK